MSSDSEDDLSLSLLNIFDDQVKTRRNHQIDDTGLGASLNSSTPSTSAIITTSTASALTSDTTDLMATPRIRPAQWNPSNVGWWFRNLESQFITNNVTDNVLKINYVVQHLPLEACNVVPSIVYKDTYQSADYDLLKKALIREFTRSQEKVLQDLLDDDSLGDSTPTQMYQRMVLLAQSSSVKIPEEIIVDRWLRKLPLVVANAMATIEGKFEPVRHLPIAERIFNRNNLQSKPPSEISAVSEQFSRPRDFEAIEPRIATTDRRSSNSRSTLSKRSPSPAAISSDTSVCWYHRRYGKAALKCITPCSWKRSGNARQ